MAKYSISTWRTWHEGGQSDFTHSSQRRRSDSKAQYAKGPGRRSRPDDDRATLHGNARHAAESHTRGRQPPTNRWHRWQGHLF